jgi:hypothetical protein
MHRSHKRKTSTFAAWEEVAFQIPTPKISWFSLLSLVLESAAISGAYAIDVLIMR